MPRCPLLIVEDDDDTLSALVEWFRLEHFDPVGVSDARSAVEKWDGGLRPAAIVLDLGLPGISGEQFLRARLLRPRFATVPALVVSGRSIEPEELDGLRVVEIVRKPFDPTMLVEAVRRHIPYRARPD